MKFLLFIILVLTGCDLPENTADIPGQRVPTPITDTALTGTFNAYTCFKYCGLKFEQYEFTELKLNGTNCIYYYKASCDQTKSYETNSVLEIETDIINGKYRLRGWGNTGKGVWDEWQNYTLAGDTLTMTNFMGNDLILTRD